MAQRKHGSHPKRKPRKRKNDATALRSVAGSPFNVQYADVNGDSKYELLVQYPVGVHGSKLKVFGWRDGELSELAHLEVGTPVGFDFGDFDGDGRTEIRTEEADWTVGLPYVSAPRVKLVLRWNGICFEEVSRQRKARTVGHEALLDGGSPWPVLFAATVD